MREEYIREHNFNEEVVNSEEQSIFLNSKVGNVIEFTAKLEEDLKYVSDEVETVRIVVMAALKTEHMNLDQPDIIVEAILADSDKRAEVLAMAERIRRQNLQ